MPASRAAAPPASRHGGASSLSGRSGPGAGSAREPQRQPQPRRMREHGEDERRAAAARAAGRGTSCSTCSRASSISRSYFTPDGHEVRQAMQPRQRSKCSATVAVQLDRPVERRLHQPDAPARRVHLLVPELVGRARRQAEAAVHAVVDQARRPSDEDALGVEGGAHALGERRPRALGAASATYAMPGAGPREQALLPRRTARGRRAGLQRARSRPTPTRPPQLAGARPDLRVDRRLAAFEEQRDPARRQEVDGARRRAASAAARSRRARGSSVSATTVASAAGRGCRRSATRAISPSRPREPEKSLPRS